MEFKKNQWIGKWVNFESYIYSENAAMQQCWDEAEQSAKAMPMFKNGVQYHYRRESSAPWRLEDRGRSRWNGN